MAKSGSLISSAYTFSDGRQKTVTFNWTSTPDNVNNQSVISWSLVGSGATTGTVVCGEIQVKIDGSEVFYRPSTVQTDCKYGTVLCTGSKIIKHNNDGSRSFKVDIGVGLYQWAINCTGSKTFILDDIPRASSFSIPKTAEAGSPFKVDITRAVSSFKHNITVKLGEREETYKSIDTTYNVTIPLEWLDQIPNADSATLSVTVVTLSGTTTIGSKTDTLTLNVPASVLPSISQIMITGKNLWQGLYVQGISAATINIMGDGIYGSRISRFEVTGGGYQFSDVYNEYTTGVLDVSGKVEFTCAVIDSRGRKVTYTSSITVVPYSKPTIVTATAERCNSAGTVLDTGTYAKVLANVTYASVNSKNTVTINCQWKLKTAASYPSGNSTTLTNNTAKVIGANALAITSYYDIKITATDTVGNTVSMEINLDASSTIFAMGKDRVSIGMYPDRAGLTVGWDTYIRGNIEAECWYTSAKDGGGGHRTFYIPNISYSSLGVSTSWKEFFEALLKWICKNYPNVSDGTFIGCVSPSSRGNVIIHIYSTADLSDGLPRHSSGLYIPFDGGLVYFGTNTFNYYFGSTISIKDSKFSSVTEEDAIKNLGIGDYIVEQGTKDIWTYRIWASGIKECWGQTATVSTKWNTWGNGGETATFAGHQKYPFTFTSQPREIATFIPKPGGDGGSGGAGAVAVSGSSAASLGDKTQTASWGGFRPNAPAGTYYYAIDLYVIGT